MHGYGNRATLIRSSLSLRSLRSATNPTRKLQRAESKAVKSNKQVDASSPRSLITEVFFVFCNNAEIKSHLGTFVPPWCPSTKPRLLEDRVRVSRRQQPRRRGGGPRTEDRHRESQERSIQGNSCPIKQGHKPPKADVRFIWLQLATFCLKCTSRSLFSTVNLKKTLFLAGIWQVQLLVYCLFSYLIQIHTNGF